LPISYQFSGKTIWVTLSGQYSYGEIEQASSRILNDPAFTDDMNLLLDARQVAVNPTLAEVKARDVSKISDPEKARQNYHRRF